MTVAGRPASAIAAVTVAKTLVGHMTYELATGDCDTPANGESDCAGFAICRCYGLRRQRPGFNRGWHADSRYPTGASVVDDLNCNSAIEDADHNKELFVRARRPEPGDLLTYPSFAIVDSNGTPHRFIGHIAIVTSAARMLEWDAQRPQWHLLDVAQCAGPNGRTPGVLATTAAHWDDHDRLWPKPEHRTALLRVVP